MMGLARRLGPKLSRLEGGTMARFYADIQGNRGQATRMGTEKSGLHGHIRGWEVGCRAEMWVNQKGEDVVTITLTGGSNGGTTQCLGSFTKEDVAKWFTCVDRNGEGPSG